MSKEEKKISKKGVRDEFNPLSEILMFVGNLLENKFLAIDIGLKDLSELSKLEEEEQEIEIRYEEEYEEPEVEEYIKQKRKLEQEGKKVGSPKARAQLLQIGICNFMEWLHQKHPLLSNGITGKISLDSQGNLILPVVPEILDYYKKHREEVLEAVKVKTGSQNVYLTSIDGSTLYLHETLSNLESYPHMTPQQGDMTELPTTTSHVPVENHTKGGTKETTSGSPLGEEFPDLNRVTLRQLCEHLPTRLQDVPLNPRTVRSLCEEIYHGEYLQFLEHILTDKPE